MSWEDLSFEEVMRIQKRICLGVPPPADETPDQAECRERLEAEIAEMVGQGKFVGFPNEIDY